MDFNTAIENIINKCREIEQITEELNKLDSSKDYIPSKNFFFSDEEEDRGNEMYDTMRDNEACR